MNITVKPQDGVLIFAKRECETCQMVEPVLGQLAKSLPTVVLTQDDPTFPSILAAPVRFLDKRPGAGTIAAHRR